ncbi:MAG: nuclear transport factor 2 family protein [Paracoccaceae bacterium]|nr:MAG: nuclear transport factor 2 family protein [Paracoccaceae bacterium]
MTLIEIANALVAGCREGREKENLRLLYAPDAVSVEGADMDGQGAAVSGLDAILGKHAWWEGAHIVHGGAVEGPFTHGDDRFAVIFDMDVENRQTGQRMQMREVAVYHVADGRIVREEFFYGS